MKDMKDRDLTAQAHNQGLFAGIVSIVLALIGTWLGIRLDPAQQTAVLVAAGFVVSAILAAFHVAASAAETAGLPAADFHSEAFWMGMISALATVAVLVFRVPLTPSQVHLLLSAAAIVVALILGTGHVGSRIAKSQGQKAMATHLDSLLQQAAELSAKIPHTPEESSSAAAGAEVPPPKG